MMPGQHDIGPFEGEREANAAARAAIAPEPGWSILSQAQRDQLLRDALTAAGVDTSEYEDGTAWWLCNWGDHVSAIIARWVTVAHEAGKASSAEAEATEWALSYVHHPAASLGLPARRVVELYPDETRARKAVSDMREMRPEDEPKLMRHEAGPWKKVPDAEVPE